MTPAPRRLLKAILLATVMAAVTSGFTVAAQTDAGLAELRDELRARRARLADKLGAGSMAILERAGARLFKGRRLRVPPGQRPPLPDRSRSAGDHPRPVARQPAPQRDPVHHAVEPAAGALRRQVPDRRRGTGTNGDRDGAVDHAVRSIPDGDVQPTALRPGRGRGANQHRSRRLLQGTGRGRRWRCGSRAHPG